MIGLDTVRFTVPVLGWRDSAPDKVFDRRSRMVLDGGARVEFESCTGQGNAYVEASLPKVMVGDNLNPLPVSDMEAAVESVVASLDDYVVTGAHRGLVDLRVLRLDIARDFHGVAHAGVLLRGLDRVARPRTIHSRLHGHGDRPETLTVGTKSWSLTAYDKNVETGGAAEPGHLRCEVRLRAKRLVQRWAAAHGGLVKVLADVTEEKMASLSKATFDAMGFGLAVTSPYAALDLVQAAALRPQERGSLLLQMMSDAKGVPSKMDAKTERKYRKIARDLGVHLSAGALSTSVRLDWETGTEVTGP